MTVPTSAEDTLMSATTPLKISEAEEIPSVPEEMETDDTMRSVTGRKTVDLQETEMNTTETEKTATGTERSTTEIGMSITKSVNQALVKRALSVLQPKTCAIN